MQYQNQITLKPPYLINTILCFNALLAIVWLWRLPFTLWLQSLLTAMIIISAYLYYTRQYRFRITALTLPRLFDSENTLWQVMTADQNYWQAIPVGQRYASSHWVLIKLHLSSFEPLLSAEVKKRADVEPTYLVLHSSQMSQQDWHHLRVICRN